MKRKRLSLFEAVHLFIGYGAWRSVVINRVRRLFEAAALKTFSKNLAVARAVNSHSIRSWQKQTIRKGKKNFFKTLALLKDAYLNNDLFVAT